MANSHHLTKTSPREKVLRVFHVQFGRVVGGLQREGRVAVRAQRAERVEAYARLHGAPRR